MPSIHALYRYPVKGLNGERLPAATLHPYKGIAGDRAYAIAHGETVFDPRQPEHLPKRKFLTLMTHPGLAALHLERTNGEHGFVLRHASTEVFRGELDQEDAVAALNGFLERFIGGQSKGMPRLVTAPNHMFSDMREDCLSIINLASVAELGRAVEQELDPLRFRANVYVAGMPAWEERRWAEGDRIRLGACVLEVMQHITRCNAINVNLETAAVDNELPKVLFRKFEKSQMGVYANVITAGSIREGDGIEVPMTSAAT